MASCIGLRHQRVEFLHPRVQPADDALQFGELLHQFGRQIGLRQQPGFEDDAGTDACRRRCESSPRSGCPASACGESCRSNCPRSFWKVTDFSRSTRSRSGTFWSVSQKKRASLKRARSTRSLPWRMRPSGSPSVFSTARKCGSSCRRRVFQREVLLVVAHDRDQDFVRQRKKFRIEVAHDYGRELREVDDGVEQRLVFAPARAGNRRAAASSALRMRCSRSAVDGDDGAVSQRLDVVLGQPDRQCARRQDAMALRWCRWRGCRRTPAARLRHRAALPASAPDARSARRTCRASTCSSPSRCRQFLSATLRQESRLPGRPFFCTVAARYSPLGVVIFSSA